MGHFPPNTRFLALLSPTRSVFGCLAGWFFLAGWLAGWLVVFGVLFGWLPWLAGCRCLLLSNTNLGHSLPKHSFLELLSRTCRVGLTLFGSNSNLGPFRPDTRFLALLSPTRSVFGCLAGWFCLFVCLAGWLAGWLVVFGVLFGWLPWLAGCRCLLLSSTNLGHSLLKHSFLELLF